MVWWLWILLGLVLLALEIITPGGFFVLFFGIAALIVGAAVGLGAGGPGWLQGVLFSTLSVVSLLLFRGPLLRRVNSRERKTSTVDSLVGEVAVLLEDLSPGAVGKAELRGSAWNVQSEEERHLSKGQRCRVQRLEGLTLWVRAV